MQSDEVAHAVERRTYDRAESAQRQIDLAIDILEADGDWTTCLTLARAAGQYASDRLKKSGEAPMLSVMHGVTQARRGEPIHFDKFKRMLIGQADALKHFNDPTEGDELVIFKLQVQGAIAIAFHDLWWATGKMSDKAKRWMDAVSTKPEVQATPTPDLAAEFDRARERVRAERQAAARTKSRARPGHK